MDFHHIAEPAREAICILRIGSLESTGVRAEGLKTILAGPTDFKRRGPRVDLRQPGALINSDGDQVNVVILDVSSGGFRLKVEANLKIGEHVTLRVGRGNEFAAQIRWTLGTEAGGEFTGPVDSTLF